MAEAPILELPNFSQVFKVFYDASHIGIKGVLSKAGHPISYYSENWMILGGNT